MRAGNLLDALGDYTLEGSPGIDISSISYDSQTVAPGTAFVAVKGFRHDGHDFVDEAVRRGASLVVAQRRVDTLGVPLVLVKDTRAALAALASEFYGHPSTLLRVIGVTGTNGKTTTTHLIRRILIAAGHETGLLGTVTNIIGGAEVPNKHTTPESVELMEMFSRMLEAGSTHAVMEVSSHALALGRVSGCEFDVGVFTNLTQDHLDFHGSLAMYRESKARLFRSLGRPYHGQGKRGRKSAVINLDDPSYGFMAGACRVPVVSYSLHEGADFTARDVEVGSGGVRFRMDYPGGSMDVSMPATGRFNVYNALAAAAAASGEGVSPGVIRDALAGFTGVRGRFQVVSGPGDPTVIVDYAHTPDGLRNVLETAREITSGRLTAVFGCGGDRDKTKRPLMGAMAAGLADRVIVTSDNPRSEEPREIAEAVAEGVKQAGRSDFEVIVDRRAAIERAVKDARPGDVVVIAGKGHETYQVFRDRTIHFDDAEVAGELLGNRGEG